MATRAIRSRETTADQARLRLCADGGDGGPPVVQLEGEFDLDTVTEIDRFLRRALGPLYDQDHLVMDLSRTTFVDSGFVAFLVRLSASQRAKQRELLLVRPAGQVRRVFGIVGLANVVPVFETTEAAVDSLLNGRVAGDPPGLRGGGRLGRRRSVRPAPPAEPAGGRGAAQGGLSSRAVWGRRRPPGATP